MLSLVIAVFIASAIASPFNKLEPIPQLDGSVKLMSQEEIQKDIEAAPFYDPQTDIDFHLYTPSNPTESQVIPLYDIAALRNSNFIAALPTILIVHGWGGDITDGTIQQPRREYLAKGLYNIIGGKRKFPVT